MSIPTHELQRFRRRWQEYEDTVSRLLPRFVVRGLADVAEDLDHALVCRDKLEQTFWAYPDEPSLVPLRARILGIDADLVLLRRGFLDRYPVQAYRAARARAAVPRSHWWWYLDEIDDGTEIGGASPRGVGRPVVTELTPAGRSD